ncbi:MAG: hypothetical protein Tsb0034_22370 [Ekhidna sp.]
MAFFKSILLLGRVLFIGIMLSNCSYSDPKPDQSTLISGDDEFGKTWQINQIEVALGTLNPKPCLVDNYVTYFPSGRYEVSEGATKCDPNDAPGIVGTWALSDSGEILTVSLGDSVQRWEVESITETKHVISSQFKDGIRTYSFHSSNQ